ncbi:DNA topoisomerase I [Nanoarchaeota archaeon]
MPRKKVDKKITLVITEKPQAAMKIAYALADISPVARKVGQVTYYEVNRNKEKILVGCAVGHLFTLAEPGKKKWPSFDLEWVPNYKQKGSEFTKKYLDVLKDLSKKASNFIVACDYDVEGEVIGLNIVRFACNQKDAKRMKFSTLTKDELNKAYDNLSPTLNWGLAYAGETRHYLDWLYGINLSRALMSAIKKAGAFRILSVGRVQGPALSLVVKKEREISKFKSSVYWNVSLAVKNGHELTVKNPKNITNKAELEVFKKLKGKKGEATTVKKDEKLMPQVPFDLTTLQMEAHRLHGYTPARTLQIAQQLYLSGIISYPRTSSQKLPPSIGYDKILKKLPKTLTSHVKRKTPIEGKKNDPAHPSIYPTGDVSGIAEKDQEKLYDLITRRFINCFCEDALIETKTVNVVVEGHKFNAKGLTIKIPGWTAVYKSRIEERKLNDLNGEVKIKDVKITEKETQPPRRYSEASLVSELAKRNLGTKATRAMIVETLMKRGYVADKQLRATKLGTAVTEALEKNSPEILNEELTREFEKEMEEIQISKNGEKKEKKIIADAKKVLTKIAEDLKKNEAKIGKQLAAAQGAIREEEKEASKVVKCVKCGKGWIAMRRSRFGQFLACDAYPDCKTTFSLPPYGLIKKTDKICADCSWPLFIAIRKGKRPWEFCANPNCKRRKEQQSYSKPSSDSTEDTKKSKVPTAKPTEEKDTKTQLKEIAEKITKKKKAISKSK